jgi:hypothetical protein
MAGITERNRQKNELASIGFSLRYIDEWQPKTTLYRHKPSYTVSGEVAAVVGTAVTGVPGSPDYVLRKAKIGLFPWMPNDSCTCRWCAQRDPVPQPVAQPAEQVAEKVVEEDISPRRGRRRTGPWFQQS